MLTRLVGELSAEIVDGVPPSNTVATRRRDRLLDMCIDDSPKGIRRKYTLKRNLHSDIGEERILIFTRDPAFDKETWANETASALTGNKAVPVLARSRLLTYIIPLKQLCLICRTHKLLKRAGPRWITILRGKDPGEFGVATWDAPDDEDIPSEEEEAINHEVRAATNNVDHAKQNRRFRRDTKTFCEQPDLEELLLVTLRCMEPQVNILHRIMWLGSKEFDDKQLIAMAKGSEIETRGLGTKGGRNRYLLKCEFRNESWRQVGP